MVSRDNGERIAGDWENVHRLVLYWCKRRWSPDLQNADRADLIQDALLSAWQRWNRTIRRGKNPGLYVVHLSKCAVSDALSGKRGYRCKGRFLRGRAFVPVDPRSARFATITK